MKKAKYILGWVILISILIFCFVVMAISFSFSEALAVYVGAIIIAALLIISIKLIANNE